MTPPPILPAELLRSILLVFGDKSSHSLIGRGGRYILNACIVSRKVLISIELEILLTTTFFIRFDFLAIKVAVD